MRTPDIDYRPMTPEEVLQAIEASRHFTASQWGNPDEILTPDTTVACWRYAYEDFPWKLHNLSRHLNDVFGLSLKWSEWRAVLTPEQKRTVWDACTFIAERAKIPRVDPVPAPGGACRSAGAFHALRHVLTAAGGNVSALKPSSILGERSENELAALFRLAPLLGDTRLAPYFPPSTRLFKAGCLLVLAGVVLAKFLSWPSAYVAWGLGAALLACETLLQLMKPRNPSDERLFTGYITVADFCRAMAAHADVDPATHRPQSMKDRNSKIELY